MYTKVKSTTFFLMDIAAKTKRTVVDYSRMVDFSRIIVFRAP